MAPASDLAALPIGWSLFSWLRRIFGWPDVRFMVHDRWANVLFLHWRIPAHLEAVLEAHTAPFRLDRFDGSAWIGLVLLTEEGVGPSVGRTGWTCVTHHGINVRTYVTGATTGALDGDLPELPTEPTQQPNQPPPPKRPPQPQLPPEDSRGIHFSSLECDDEFTSLGANLFGMPYRVSRIARTYFRAGDATGYRMRSERLPSGAPSLLRWCLASLRWWRPRVLHSTTSEETGKDPQTPPTGGASTGTTFAVDCSWSSFRRARESESPDRQVRARASLFSDWACERYFVYTEQYGTLWRGEVDHEPWPMEEGVLLGDLSIEGVGSYDPPGMRPVLSHMAEHKPEKVGFSRGVGPVRFRMLRPLDARGSSAEHHGRAL